MLNLGDECMGINYFVYFFVCLKFYKRGEGERGGGEGMREEGF